MTYIVDLLLDAWEKEQLDAQLQPLPEGIDAAVNSLYNELQDDLARQTPGCMQAGVIKEELRMLVYTWNDLLGMRRRKLDARAGAGEASLGPGSLAVEREYFTAAKAALALHERGLLAVPGRRVTSEPLKQSGKYMVVRFIEDADEIIGLDMITHGPFKKDDMAHIPRENADVFIAGGKARKVHV